MTQSKAGQPDQPGLSSSLSPPSLSMTPLSSRDQVSKKRKLKVQKKLKEKEVIQKEKRSRHLKACPRFDKKITELQEKTLELKREISECKLSILNLEHGVHNFYVQRDMRDRETAQSASLRLFMLNVELHLKETIVSEFPADEKQYYYVGNRPYYEAFSELHIRHVILRDSRIREIFLHKYFNGDESFFSTFLSDSTVLKKITSEEAYPMKYYDKFISKQTILDYIAQADCDVSLKARATSYAEWLPPVVPFLESLDY